MKTHLSPELEVLMSQASSAATFLAPHEDDKVKIIRWESEGGGSGYAVNLADGRRVFQSSDWGGWHVEQFHAGRWCQHIIAIAEEARRRQEERQDAERAAAEAAEAANWTPVDDVALFAGEASDEPDPTRFYRWIAEIEVNEVWVADGFQLTDDRLKEMVASDLSMANYSEFRARVVHAPAEESLATAQGYQSVEQFRTAQQQK